MAAWGRGCGSHPSPLPKGEGSMAAWGRGCGSHPSPLPKGEGVDGGLGPWVWLSPQPSPKGRGGRWRPGAVGVALTPALSQRERGSMAAWGRGCGSHPSPLPKGEGVDGGLGPWVWLSPQPSPKGRGGRWRPGAVGVALTPALSQRERGSMAAWGRRCGSHPSPLPKGEGVDGGPGPWVWLSPQPSPRGRGGRWRPGAVVWPLPQPSPRGRGGRRVVIRISATSLSKHLPQRACRAIFYRCALPL